MANNEWRRTLGPANTMHIIEYLLPPGIHAIRRDARKQYQGRCRYMAAGEEEKGGVCEGYEMRAREREEAMKAKRRQENNSKKVSLESPIL